MHMRSLRRGSFVGALALVALVATGALMACTRTKKLTSGDGVWDGFVHGVLNMDRDAAAYYAIVRESHDAKDFSYRVTQDEFVVDKVVDAVQRLGALEYERIEGEAQVFALLTDVLLDDRAALARAAAANSLTRLTLKLPPITGRLQPERGERFRALVREMDALYAGTGAGRTDGATTSRRTVRILSEIGHFALPDVRRARDALKPFYTRTYLVNAPTSAVRAAADAALVARMRDTARLALRSAVSDPVDYVREGGVRGLKTLGDREAEGLVLARLADETGPRVRAEITEYLGVAASPQAIRALLPMLEDGNPALRLKARESLTRIAGRDLGIRRATWTRWARARDPNLDR